MGVIGTAVGTFGGGLLGKQIGKRVGYESGGEAFGSTIGGYLGSLSPYEKGGRVKGRRGYPVPILAHGQEYVLPEG